MLRTSLPILLVLTAAASAAVQAPPVIRVDVQLVTVDVGAFDRAGRPILDLRREDFLIFEDGHPQDIRYFAPAEQPYNVVLLFDCSDSTSAHRPFLRKAVEEFSKHRREGDHIQLATFGSQVYPQTNWDENGAASTDFDFSRPERGRGSRGGCSGTALYGALQWAGQQLRSVQTRKGIVILTDGVDSSPVKIEEEQYQKTLSMFQATRVPIYFLGVGTDVNPTVGVTGNPPAIRIHMERLAEVSGGRAVFPKRVEDLVPAYDQIGRDLRTLYSIGYAPPNPISDGKRHSITVRLRSGDARLEQSRKDYIWRDTPLR